MAVTAVAVAVKVADVAPAATVTEAGVLRYVLLSESVTTVPPAEAAAASVTVQVLVPPEGTLVGLHCNADNALGATMVRVAVCELAPKEAVITAV